MLGSCNAHWVKRLGGSIGLGACSFFAHAAPVTTCADDNSAGSLRKVIANANTNDVVDLSTLVCPYSAITLALGAIPVGVSNLTLQGPSPPHAPLTISANGQSRVFVHSPFPLPDTGTLSIDKLTIASGKYAGSGAHVRGGCIYSSANVILTNSTVTGCEVRQNAGGLSDARGGAIYAVGTVTLTDSTVSNNTAWSQSVGYAARGGGICAGNVDISYSTVTANTATVSSGASSYGGGIEAGNVTITASTVDSNKADIGAGILLFGDGLHPSARSSVINSTISANTAISGTGGIAMTYMALLDLFNSTVAFNSSMSGTGGLSTQINNTLRMYSSIVAENSTVSGPAADLSIYHSAGISGSHNLVMQTDYSPTGLIATSSNPRLVRLGNHGGNTRTCALQSFSPALEQGYLFTFLFDDQRGLGYSRNVGSGIDIGAYERQFPDDEIFADSLDY